MSDGSHFTRAVVCKLENLLMQMLDCTPIVSDVVDLGGA